MSTIGAISFSNRISELRRSSGMIAAAKLAVFVAAVAVLASTVVPSSLELLAAAVPRVYASARGCLVPSYLFVAVHLIILAIWKLSEQRFHRPDEAKPPETGSALEVSRHISEPPAAAATAVLEVEKSVELDTVIATPPPPPPLADVNSLEARWKKIVAAAEERSDESQAPAPASVELSAAPPPPRGVESSDLGHDEWNRRFEEFIKKNYEQILVNGA